MATLVLVLLVQALPIHVDGTVRFVNSGFAGFEAHNTNGTW